MHFTNNFNWPGRGKLLADPHFGHLNITTFERKQFKTIEEHDQCIINAINNDIRETDTLIIAGDLGEEFSWIDAMKQIKKCKKVLVLGNHDKLAMHKYEEYFDVIIKGPLFLNKYVVISHEPLPLFGHYFTNIHGHLHGSIIETEDNEYINANIHILNYKLLDLEDVFRKACVKNKNIREKFTEEWYRNDYKFLTERYDIPVYRDTNKIIPKEVIFPIIEIVNNNKSVFKEEKITQYAINEVLKYNHKNKEFYKKLYITSKDNEKEIGEKIVKFLSELSKDLEEERKNNEKT